MEIKFKTKKISNVEKKIDVNTNKKCTWEICLLYTSPSPRDA